MRSRISKLFSWQALPGYILPGLSLIYGLINFASNFEFVRNHILSSHAWQVLVSNSTAISVVLGVLWLTAVVMKPEWFERRRLKLAEPKETIANKQFFHETVRLDGRRFEGCTFIGCRFEFYGTARCSFADDCVVRKNFFIITLDDVSNAYIDAWKALSKAAGPTVTFHGKQSQVTGEFFGPY